jgi:hypothetical protein
MGAEAFARCLGFPREDITLEEIFRVVGWFATNAEDLMAAELDAEMRLCRPWPPMVALFNEFKALGRRPVVISDMYLPASFLGRLLEAKGICASGVYVSSDLGLRKGTGHLFEEVRRREGEPFENWVHVGDHPVSDQARPRALGMEVVPVVPLRPKVKAPGLLGSAMAALGCQAAGEGFWRRAGAQWVGPLVLGYAYLLAERVRELKVERVVFAGGETRLFRGCLQRLCPLMDVGCLEPSREASEPARLANAARDGFEGEVALVGPGWRDPHWNGLADLPGSIGRLARIHRLSVGPALDGALPEPSLGVLAFLLSGAARPWAKVRNEAEIPLGERQAEEDGGEAVRRQIEEGVNRFLDAFLDVFSEGDFLPDEFGAFLGPALSALLADPEMAGAVARANPAVPTSFGGSREASGRC